MPPTNDAKIVGIDRRLEEVKNLATQTPPMQGASDAWAAWTPSHAQPSGAPGGHGPGGQGGAGHGGQGGAGGGGGRPPHGPHGGPANFDGTLGPVGNVASGKLFDDKVALDSRYQFNGSKESGAQWRAGMTISLAAFASIRSGCSSAKKS